MPAVADQNLHRPQAVANLGDHALHLLVIGHVGHHWQRPHAVLLYIFRGRFYRLAVGTTVDRHVGTQLR